MLTAKVRNVKGYEGPVEDAPWAEVKVGDVVEFKSDYEQAGVITKIEAGDRWTGAKLHLHNDGGFGGDYLRYAKDTVEAASDCWISR